jgi:hypothetical protein
MANLLKMDKQIMVTGALADGSSVRSIERTTGVHRDALTRLGVKAGQGCTKLMGSPMRNLPCTPIDADTKVIPAFKCGDLLEVAA